MGANQSAIPETAYEPARADKDVGDEPTQSKCPVDHSKIGKSQLSSLWHSSRSSSASSGKDADQAKSSSTCPVDHKNMSREQIENLKVSASATSAVAMASIAKTKNSGEVSFDVYGQVINKANMMPAVPNQLPSPGQSAPLSTDRERSSIPKAGEEEGTVWTYPSPQMFYNSLRRKGKADDVKEEDMDVIVSVHNSMNEKTWAEVVDWEKRFHCDQCDNPKLKRFQGRPNDLSPAARFRVWFQGYPMPFDRHDWIVDRCGKEDVRYIIDYYHRDVEEDPIEIHVRPALDSFGALKDRLASVATSLFRSPENTDTTVKRPSSNEHRVPVVEKLDENISPTEYEFLRTLTSASIEKISDAVRTKCAKAGQNLKSCGDDEERCRKANISLNYCMAQQICKPQADSFIQALQGEGDESQAYNDMTGCLDRFFVMARRVALEAAGISQQGPEFPTETPAATT